MILSFTNYPVFLKMMWFKNARHLKTKYIIHGSKSLIQYHRLALKKHSLYSLYPFIRLQPLTPGIQERLLLLCELFLKLLGNQNWRWCDARDIIRIIMIIMMIIKSSSPVSSSNHHQNQIIVESPCRLKNARHILSFPQGWGSKEVSLKSPFEFNTKRGSNNQQMQSARICLLHGLEIDTWDQFFF